LARTPWERRTSGLDYEADVDATLDLLADHIEKHIDCDRLLVLARPPLLTRRT
jgi:adenosylcobyric acid synthase